MSNIVFSSKQYSIYKFPPHFQAPALESPKFISITITHSNVSIIAETGTLKEAEKEERGWEVLYIDGELPFDAVGVLVRILSPLAREKISILAHSTFDTDYVFFKKENRDRVIRVLKESNFQIKLEAHK